MELIKVVIFVGLFSLAHCSVCKTNTQCNGTDISESTLLQVIAQNDVVLSEACVTCELWESQLTTSKANCIPGICTYQTSGSVCSSSSTGKLAASYLSKTSAGGATITQEACVTEYKVPTSSASHIGQMAFVLSLGSVISLIGLVF
jgi:hypothetical protein